MAYDTDKTHQEEAIAGRARMSANPNSLLPRLVHDPNVRPPYSNTQISEAAMHRETLHIFEIARPETRPIYERGHYFEGGNEENWIIKWLLWHVFRYRDNRNRGRTLSSWAEQRSTQVAEATLSRLSSNESFPGYQMPSGSHSSAYSPVSADSPGSIAAPSGVAPSGGLAQPQDDTSTFSHRTTHMQSKGLKLFFAGLAQEVSPHNARPYQSQGYWDPVRDAQRTNR